MQTSSNPNRRAVLSEINVTPLVDVMLVLLIMFMVTAPLLQQGIDVDLPKTESSGFEPSSEPLILTIDSKTKLSLGQSEVSPAELREKLRKIMSQRKNKQLYIRADQHVEYGKVAEVMAEVRAAGVYNIGLITLPK